MEIISQAGKSVINFFKLIASHYLHIRRNRLRSTYKVHDHIYSVFRETTSDKEYNEKEVTLVIGFRLKCIGNNSFFHYLFQRLSIINTPIWVGFRGFKTKFWMVDIYTNNYLGIYKYQGKHNAQKYAKYITSVLKLFSTKDSLWSEIITTNFENYIKKIKVKQNSL